jgi:hypothetical protein
MQTTSVKHTDTDAMDKTDACYQRMRHILREQAPGGWQSVLSSDGKTATLTITAELVPPFEVLRVSEPASPGEDVLLEDIHNAQDGAAAK